MSESRPVDDAAVERSRRAREHERNLKLGRVLVKEPSLNGKPAPENPDLDIPQVPALPKKAKPAHKKIRPPATDDDIRNLM